jgi:putative cell wall-binding protein
MIAGRVVAGVITALLTLLTVPGPALAAEGPRAVDLRPAPGEVVGTGSVPLAARVEQDDPAGQVELRVDGQPIGGVTARGPVVTVRAAPSLAPGDHVAQVLAGGHVLRAWRFTVSGLDVLRLDGGDDVLTSVGISRDRFRLDGTARNAVLVRVDDVAGALAGAPLTRASEGPLLLTEGDRLEPAVGAELRRVLPPGSPVSLVGDADVFSDELVAEVEALGLVPTRIGGDDLVATALAVADVLGPEAGTVVVASTEGLSHALALSGPAAANGWPVLLTGPDDLDENVRAHLEEAAPEEIVVAGGPAIVSGATLRGLRAIAPRVTRVWGEDRYTTAQASADRFYDAPDVVALAAGEDRPVAVAGGVHAAAYGAPLLLVPDRLPQSLRERLADRPPIRAVVYGTDVAFADRVTGELRRAVADGDGPSVRAVTPLPGSEVRELDEIVVSFDRRVLPAHSTLSLTLAGREVAGTLSARGPEALVLTLADPAALPARRADLRLVGAATDGEHWVHLDERLSWAGSRSARPSG